MSGSEDRHQIRRPFTPLAAFGAALVFLGSGVLPARDIEVTGRISTQGVGLSKATIELQPLHDGWRLAQNQLQGDFEPEVAATSRSQHDGSFRILAPQPGMWRLVVRHPGHLPAAFELMPLLDDLALPVVELARRQEIEVRIVDTRGRAIGGLRLFARERPSQRRGDGWRPETRQAVTGEDGWAVLAGHAEEPLIVAALGEDHFLHQDLEAGSRDVTLRLEEPLADSRLLAADGRPAPGVVGVVRRPFLAVAVSGPAGEIRVPLRRDRDLPLSFLDDRGTYGAARLAEDRSLRLAPSVEVAGHVLDLAGRKPIADAWVWTPGGYRRTDRQGAFSLRLGKGRNVGFRAAAPGYLETRVQLEELQLEKGLEEVVLTASTTLSGRVVDLDGHPLPGADLQAIPRAEKFLIAGLDGVMEEFHGPGAVLPGPISARTDDGGRFRVAGIIPGPDYELQIRLEGYQARRIAVPAIESGELPERLEIALEPGSMAVGFVVDPEARPIVGAEVELRANSPTLSSLRSYSAVTDSEGRFESSGLEPGTFLLVASAPGYTEKIVPGIEILTGQSQVEVGEVTLDPTVTLYGHVTDPDGQELSGARVAARQLATIRPHRQLSAQTGGDGSFELERVPRGVPLQVRVSHEWFRETVLSDILADPETPLHVVLKPGIRLAGRVVDLQDLAVAGANVELRRELDGGWLTTTTETAGSGRFRFPAQASGKVTLLASSEQGRVEPLALELVMGQADRDVTLVMKPAATLQGRVVSPDGSAIAGAHLSAERQPSGARGIQGYSTAVRKTSAEDGRFYMGGLEPGRYLLAAEHPDFESLSELRDLEDAVTQEVELVFRRRRQRRPISGQVVDPAGEGLSGADIRLLALDLGPGSVGQTVSGRGGGFELSAPRDGTYALVVGHPGLALRRTEPFAVGGEGVESLLVQLQRGASIAGHILGVEIEDFHKLSVSAYAPAYGGRRVDVDDEGRYRVSNLPEGEWRITARMSNPERAVSGMVTLGNTEEAVLDLRFEIGHRLSGLALRDGEPLAGADLKLVCPQGRFRDRTSSDAAGWFAIDSVPAAGCVLTLSDPRSGRTRRQELAVTGAVEVTIEVSASEAG